MLTDEVIRGIAEQCVTDTDDKKLRIDLVDDAIKIALVENGKIGPLPCPFCGDHVIVRWTRDKTYEQWLHPENKNCPMSDTDLKGHGDWNMRVDNG